jgi:hypothetical protein
LRPENLPRILRYVFEDKKPDEEKEPGDIVWKRFWEVACWWWKICCLSHDVSLFCGLVSFGDCLHTFPVISLDFVNSA